MKVRAATTGIALGAVILAQAVAAFADPTVVVSPAAVPAPTQVTVEPNGYHDDGGADYWGAPVFTSGALVLIASYGAAVIAASDSSHKGDDHLYVPLAGPWIDLATRDGCPVVNTGCDHETTDKVLIAVDGVFQAAGFLSLIDGVFDPRRHTVVRTADRGVHVHPMTMSSVSGAAPGLALSGGF